MRVRILTFNVWNTEGQSHRTALINQELRRLAPDLLALQEVVHTPDRDRLDELVGGTGLFATHQTQVMPSVPPGVDRYGGTAVATRWPHWVVEALDLRVSDAPDTPWSTLAVSVPLPDIGDLLFIATTGAWWLDAESARERQAVALTDLDARHRGDSPTIIAGDLNASPDAACVRYLTGLQTLGGRSVHYHDAWAVAGEGPGYTWTVENPNAKSVIDQIVGQPNHRRRIDYVFDGSWHAHKLAYCRVRAATLAFDRPVDGIWLSDHYGVVVDLEIGKNE